MDIAIITGASKGMGREFAAELDKIENFDEIWLIARSGDKLLELSKILRNSSKIIKSDLTDMSNIKKISALMSEKNVNIKYLVNAAGFGKFGSVASQSDDDIINMINLNISALVMLTAAALPYMKESGRIVNFASASGYSPLPSMNIYAATKAFVIHFSQALNNELRERKISVTAVCPSWVDTDFLDVAAKTKRGNSVNRFPLIADVNDVVLKALRDSLKNKMTSVYGISANAIRLCSRILPVKTRMLLWNIIKFKK